MTIRTTKLLSVTGNNRHMSTTLNAHTYCYRGGVLERQKDREERIEKDTEKGEEKEQPDRKTD